MKPHARHRFGINLLVCVLIVSGCGDNAKNSRTSTESDNHHGDTARDEDVAKQNAMPETNVSTVDSQSQADELLPEGYVGTAECASCHSERHKSYQLTHHSRSLARLGEPHIQSEGQGFDHEKSHRFYDVLAEKDAVLHQEWRRFAGGRQDVKVNQLPVEYVMGSGAFAHGYLLEDEGFLIQSPITWYAKNDACSMAPGYDTANHWGMTRVINTNCLYCHAGVVTSRNGNYRKPVIHELAIGCERCHGPGKEHTQLYRSLANSGKTLPAGESSMIVNPRELDRLKLESICTQCHLQGEILVHAAGKEIWDFRPGQDLAEIRLHYKNQPTESFEKVFTGHVDQLWQSPCYRQSETLTCITCHDSHRSEPIEDLVAYRRDQCQQCHADRGCAITAQQRETSNGNDCVSCHMPTLPSEVPHTSTTSHLIAVYEEGSPRGLESGSEGLRRLLHVDSKLAETELDRRDRVAAMTDLIDQTKLEKFADIDRLTSREIQSRFLPDADADVDFLSLHAILLRQKSERLIATGKPGEAKILSDAAAASATKVLELETVPSQQRESALEVLGMITMEANDFANATQCFGELTMIRRNASDHYNLALALARQQRFQDAEKLFHRAIQLDGNYYPAYRSLSVLYRSVNPPLGQQFSTMAELLSETAPESPPATASDSP